MVYSTHVAFALTPPLAIETIGNYFPLEYEIIFYLGLLFGALSPDLDEENSKLGKMFPVFPIIYDLLKIEHRGITHKLIFVIAMSIMFFFIILLNSGDGYSISFLYGFAFGYLFHLFGDMLTKGGIRDFFYPFFEGVQGVLLPYRFRFYTNSKIEYTILFFLVISIVLLILTRVYNEFF